MEKNYWCYRIDTSKINYFKEELENNRLRQGWGWDIQQDLRKFELDEGAGRNKPMFNYVKKGDILLVPNLPNWGEVAIVEATEDWNIGYKFEIETKFGDYGHVFPAKYIKSFVRTNKNVAGTLRSTLKNPSRFWNIKHYANDVDILLNTTETDLSISQNHNNRLEASIKSVFNDFFEEKKFTDTLYTKLTNQFQSAEWENALVAGLKQMFPNYIVEHVGGKNEQLHGTDILIKLPSIIPDYQYAIAIQIKDYSNIVSNDVINQINKASYFENDNLKLIDKIVIIIRAEKAHNLSLVNEDKNIKYIFVHEFKQILSEIGKKYLGINRDFLNS